MKKLLTVGIVAAVLAAAALAYAGHWGSAYPARWGPGYEPAHYPPTYYGHRPCPPGHLPGARRGGGWLNATLYSTTRQLTISGAGVEASLSVDVVNRNASSPYGAVVYGSGVVKLGDGTYTAKSVYGHVGPYGAELRIYTGRELIYLRYREDRYWAVVKTLGEPGARVYNGTASLKIA